MFIKELQMIYALFITCLLSPAICSGLDWLSIEGSTIVNEQKKPVTLRGINLGGWLVEEMWMTPFETTPPKRSLLSEIEDHTSLWETCALQYGEKTMHAIKHAYRTEWITEKDFQRIKKLGFTFVRLPFLFDLEHEPEGLFYWLDKAVAYAKKHDLYIILDMHGAPGRQSMAQHTGKKASSTLFLNESCQIELAILWKKIAKHYKNEPVILGYDLLNEPMAAESKSELYNLYNTLYNAIYAEDKKHIIIMQDGYKGVSRLPKPKKNVAYSRHIYLQDKHEPISRFYEQVNKIKQYQEKSPTAFFIGEYNAAPHADIKRLETFLKTFNEKGLYPIFWTYKSTKKEKSIWSLYTTGKKTAKLDFYKDVPNQLFKKIKRLNTDYCKENNQLKKLFAAH